MRTTIEKIVFVAAALILSGALWRFLSGGDGGIEGDQRTQVILMCLYGLLVIFAVMKLRDTAASLWRNPALLALLLLACISPLWSESPDLVFRRAIGLAGTTLFGVLLATRYSFEDQLRILRAAFQIAAAGTLAVLLVSPIRVFSAIGGGDGLRGVFPHKNILGAAMALGFVVEWYVRDPKRKAKAFRLVALFVYSGLLLASNSMTSIVTVLATLGGVWIVRVLRARHGIPLSVISGFAVAGGVALTVTGIKPDDFLWLLGRSSDMTGRTELWNAVVQAISQRPLLGFGFSGFWKGASAGSEIVQGQIQWIPAYSHNGYLEVALSLGLVGLFLVIVLLAQGFRRAWAYGHSGNSRQSFWPLALFMFVALHNLTECSIAWQNCLEWSVCVATIVGCDPRLLLAFERSEARRQPAEQTPEALSEREHESAGGLLDKSCA